VSEIRAAREDHCRQLSAKCFAADAQRCSLSDVLKNTTWMSAYCWPQKPLLKMYSWRPEAKDLSSARDAMEV
jgi:hypothetical protein